MIVPKPESAKQCQTKLRFFQNLTATTFTKFNNKICQRNSVMGYLTQSQMLRFFHRLFPANRPILSRHIRRCLSHGQIIEHSQFLGVRILLEESQAAAAANVQIEIGNQEARHGRRLWKVEIKKFETATQEGPADPSSSKSNRIRNDGTLDGRARSRLREIENNSGYWVAHLYLFL